VDKMGRKKIKKFKRIIPQVEICVVCKKRRVTDHHIVCNKCCSKRDRLINKEKTRKLLNLPPKKRK